MNMKMISEKCWNALDEFLLNNPNVSEEEREEILERMNKYKGDMNGNI